MRPTQGYYIGDKDAGATRTMAATSFSQIHHFDPDNEGIESYLERVELYFQANGIADAKRVPVFLSVIGGNNYALLRDLLVPAKPSVKTFAELEESLKGHYKPKRMTIAERFR